MCSSERYGHGHVCLYVLTLSRDPHKVGDPEKPHIVYIYSWKAEMGNTGLSKLSNHCSGGILQETIKTHYPNCMESI